MISLAVRRPAANTTSIREGYASSPRRNIYSASVNLSVKVLDFVKSGRPSASLYNVDAAAHLPDRTQGEFQFVVSAPRPNGVDRSHSCCIHFCWMPKRAAPQPSPTPAAAPTTTAAIPTPMLQGAAEPSQTAEAYRRGSSTTHSYSNANACPSISHAGPITHGCGRTYSEPNSGSYSGADARGWRQTR